MQCEKRSDQIILRPMAEMKFVGVFATFFICVGVFLLFSMFHQENGTFSAAGFEGADWFGVGFLVVWTSLAGWMSYTALWSKIRYRIVLDRYGVHEKGVPLRKEQRQLRWSEIWDYGYYYMGNHKFNGKVVGGIYRLYFSPEQLETRNAYKKKANKNMIQIDIDERELEEIAEGTVFPFCRQYRCFAPRTVEKKSHFM